ncbi:MAG TPA: S1C family serine protease [Burkholderiales bacterium]
MEWAFPSNLQPDPKALGFDLDRALNAMVQVRVEIPEDAFTAQILGTERIGSGAVIREDGLLLTIGYLITEASSIWLTTRAGEVMAGHPLAYDQATGLGLVQPLGRLGLPALERGSAASVEVGDPVVVAGHGGQGHALQATLADKREFAGYWEYVLDEALFTTPGHPQWGGTAALDAMGRLVGIGSLYVQEKLGPDATEGNMVVPIDVLEPIFDDLLATGRSRLPVRPWLGMYTTEVDNHLVVAGLAERAPAAVAGVRVSDIILEVAGERPTGLADLFRRIWSLGAAGVEVPLAVSRRGSRIELRLKSADRGDFLKKPSLH